MTADAVRAPRRGRDFLLGLALPLPAYLAGAALMGRGMLRSPQEPWYSLGGWLLAIAGAVSLTGAAISWRTRRARAWGLLASILASGLLLGGAVIAMLFAMHGALTG